MYSSVRHNGMEYKVGDACYVLPDSFSFKVQQPVAPSKKVKSDKGEVSM